MTTGDPLTPGSLVVPVISTGPMGKKEYVQRLSLVLCDLYPDPRVCVRMCLKYADEIEQQLNPNSRSMKRVRKTENA